MVSLKSGIGPKRWSALLAGACAAVIAFPGTALAAPPPALPYNATWQQAYYQPVYDYDTDGCYPTPAIDAYGNVNGGLEPTGALNGDCRDLSDLYNTNGYARSKSNNGWTAHMYALYFEKDQVYPKIGLLPHLDLVGHRHDWEHVVVWVNDDDRGVKYVSTSAHGGYTVHDASNIHFTGFGTNAKIVYHKDDANWGTHALRAANSNDDPPENHLGAWRAPTLVGWDGFPAGVRDKLTSADFGKASFALKDGSFELNLDRAKPSGIAFDPYAAS